MLFGLCSIASGSGTSNRLEASAFHLEAQSQHRSAKESEVRGFGGSAVGLLPNPETSKPRNPRINALPPPIQKPEPRAAFNPQTPNRKKHGPPVTSRWRRVAHARTAFDTSAVSGTPLNDSGCPSLNHSLRLTFVRCDVTQKAPGRG